MPIGRSQKTGIGRKLNYDKAKTSTGFGFDFAFLTPDCNRTFSKRTGFFQSNLLWLFEIELAFFHYTTSFEGNHLIFKEIIFIRVCTFIHLFYKVLGVYVIVFVFSGHSGYGNSVLFLGTGCPSGQTHSAQTMGQE
ncbi:MAG: hypothetical protein BWY75_03539 [bacterium ADurb.Bin425]|nr:MAG: hypothetical protein BWY75_03539 [bacterium ADurb.Bin425]